MRTLTLRARQRLHAFETEGCKAESMSNTSVRTPKGEADGVREMWNQATDLGRHRAFKKLEEGFKESTCSLTRIGSDNLDPF